MRKKEQTTPQENPGKRPNWRCGAPSGNTNAKKPVPGLYTLRKRVLDLRRRVKAAIALVP